MTLLCRKLVPTAGEHSKEPRRHKPLDAQPTKFHVGTAIQAEIDNVRTNAVSHLAEMIAKDFDNDHAFAAKQLENP